MANSNGLAVGLAVGIPSFIVIVLISIFWYRNQRKQQQEDFQNENFDKDDSSFQQFQDELHKQELQKQQIHQQELQKLDSQSEPSSSNSKKNRTTYEFYETFIPVLDQNVSNPELNQESSTIITHHQYNNSQDLAKQLNNPAFFEKLPRKATQEHVFVKPRYPSTNNSSSELVNNYLLGDTHAINDHYQYEAGQVVKE